MVDLVHCEALVAELSASQIRCESIYGVRAWGLNQADVQNE